MVVSGSSGIIYSMNSSFPGSNHDSPIFKSSILYQKLKEGWMPFDPRKYGVPYPHSIILGDSAYPSKDWFLGNPYLEGSIDTESKRQYNLACCAARVCVEHCIGELKNRWPILKYGFRYLKMSKCSDLILVLGALHNFIKRNGNADDLLNEASEKKSEVIVNHHVVENNEGNEEMATRDRIRMQFFE